MTTTYDYVIIGGGITGLTAAYEISKFSDSYCIIEPELLGGAIQTAHVDGFTLERGATTLVLTPEIQKIISELNLTSAVAEPVIKKFTQFVWHNHKPHAVPKSPPALIRSTLFTTFEKIRIIAGLFRHLTKIDSYISLGTLFERILGSGPVRKALAPALRGIYGGDVYSLDARYIFSKLTTHLLHGGSLFEYVKSASKTPRTIFHLRGGNSILIESIVKHIGDQRIIRKRAQMITVNGLPSVSLEDGTILHAQKIFIATSGVDTASIISQLSEEFASALRTIRYAPISVVHVSVPKSAALLENAFGILFPGDCDSKIIGALFNSQLFPHTAPHDRHLITVCVGGVHQQDFPIDDRQSVEKIVLSELQRLLNISDGIVLSFHHWKRAIPQYEATIHDLYALMQKFEAQYPNITCIGVDRGGVGVPDRVSTAFEAIFALGKLPQPQPHVEKQALLRDTLQSKQVSHS